MRALHLILTLERAGAQAVLRTLAACTPPERAQLVMATFEDGAVREDLERLGVRVVVLGPRRFGIERPLAFLREQRALLGALRQLGHERVGQAELQRVEAEGVGHGMVQPVLLPGQQIAAGRRPEPGPQLYNRVVPRHDAHRTACLRRQLHLDAA